MKKILLLFFPLIIFIFPTNAQDEATYISEINLEVAPKGKVSKYWLHIIDNGMGQAVHIPVLIAKGIEEGPTLGLIAAIHGNELNGIPIIQNIFENIDPTQLKGSLIGIPGINIPSINRDQRRYPDQSDLNRLFPGKEKGNRSQQYVWQINQKILPPFDYLVDMHTASFGRINSLYVRGDLENEVISQMAHWQDADIILHGKGPSAGNVTASTRTLRAEAMLKGIPTITVEYGNPQVYQPDMTMRGIKGIENLMRGLKMKEGDTQIWDHPPVVCKKSYWIYMEKGGLLEVPVELAQHLEKGDLIGRVRNPFGEIIKEYFAPEAGVVIGKSTNPVNMDGGRIIHLGIKK